MYMQCYITEKFQPAFYNIQFQCSSGSVMVWIDLRNDRICPIHCLQGNFNFGEYIKLLKEVVKPYKTNMSRGFLFQVITVLYTNLKMLKIFIQINLKY